MFSFRTNYPHILLHSHPLSVNFCYKSNSNKLKHRYNRLIPSKQYHRVERLRLLTKQLDNALLVKCALVHCCYGIAFRYPHAFSFRPFKYSIFLSNFLSIDAHAHLHKASLNSRPVNGNMKLL